MSNTIFRLYPLPSLELSLQGLYLAHDLRGRQAANPDQPFVYTNYVTSLDGRIAVPHPTQPGLTVPKQVANDRDWRLFQELTVQADVILTSGRYLREYAAGRAQEILRVYDDPRFADLKEWRLARGLTPQPALAVISASLDFPIPEALTHGGRTVLVLTTAQADPTRVAALEEQLGRVLVAGQARVAGRPVVERLWEQGYRLIYNATGPLVMHLLLADSVLDRLYMTLANRLLGGQPFSSIVEGPLLTPAVDMRLHAAYFDPHGLDGLGQMFLSFDRA